MIARDNKCIGLTVCVILLISFASGSSFIEPSFKEELDEHLKDAAHKEGAEAVKLEKQKGEKTHEVETNLSDSHKNLLSKAHDEAKYLKKDYDTKSSQESDAYEGHNAKQDKVEDSAASGFKRGHKKGHHKQGFQNSYHKDESSNKSTFFDDFNDEGDQAQYNSRLNSHDNQGGRRYHGSHNNGQQYERDDYRGGGYNRYDDTGLKHASHQDHGKNYYLDDRHLQNRYNDDRNIYDRNKVHDRHFYREPPPPPPPRPVHHDPGWDWQRWENSRRGWDDRRWDNPGWGRDYGGPGYYDDRGLRHAGGYGYGPNNGYGYVTNNGYESRNDPVKIPKDAPVVTHTKQTITIYEDPRYDGKDKGQLRKEEGDYLQLEYKPASHRYASYDDTYYNSVPTKTDETGSVEASKVNRLVYNYKRQ